MNKEYDLNQMSEILKHLRSGWSVTVAVKRAGVTVKEYKYLMINLRLGDCNG